MAMSQVVREFFYDLESAGAILLIADGLRIIGGNVSGPDASRRAYVQFETVFFPGPRYQQDGDIVALGFFERYDLWFARQEPLPPTLIARFGNGSAYYSTNPYLLSVDQITASGPWAIEALKRAQHLKLIPTQE
jgi:hypothetical protein